MRLWVGRHHDKRFIHELINIGERCLPIPNFIRLIRCKRGWHTSNNSCMNCSPQWVRAVRDAACTWHTDSYLLNLPTLTLHRQRKKTVAQSLLPLWWSHKIGANRPPLSRETVPAKMIKQFLYYLDIFSAS